MIPLALLVGVAAGHAAPALAGAPPTGPHAAHQRQLGTPQGAWDRWADGGFGGAPALVPPPAAPRATVYGYWAYWGDDPTQLDFARLTHVALFNADLESDGTLSATSHWTSVAGAVIPIAHSYGVKVHLCLTSFDSSTMSSVLGSASRRATTIAALKTLVDAYGGDGVNIDFEGLPSSQRDNFVTFIQELALEVEDVYLATPAVDWSGSYDYDRLAAASDGLFIMGYAYHWTGGNPGPNDPLYGGGAWGSYSLEWTVDDYLANDAPADKIILGLPLYGQEWPTSSDDVPGDATGSGWSVVKSEAEGIAADEGREYDGTTHSPYVLRSGSQLWYDDTSSLQERISWAMGRELQGIGFWALTYEGDDPDFWDMIEAETTLEGSGGTDSGGDSGGTDSGGDSGDGGGDTGASDDGPPQADVVRGESPGGCATTNTPAAMLALAGLVMLRARRVRGPQRPGGAGIGGAAGSDGAGTGGDTE